MAVFTYRSNGAAGANTVSYVALFFDYNNTVTFSSDIFRKAEGAGNVALMTGSNLVWTVNPFVYPLQGRFDGLRLTADGNEIWTIRNWNVDAGDFFDAALTSQSAMQAFILRGHDKITGSARNDTLLGGDGSDSMFGGAGLDVLFGDAGDDRLYGNVGKSNLQGGDGQDRLYGGTLGDSLVGGAEADVIYGDGGSDYAYGGTGADVYYGGAGNDSANGDQGADRLYGGAGRDQFEGADGNDLMYGGSGGDFLLGDAQNDRLYGGAGDDALYGGTGNDTLSGGAGYDVMIGNVGADVFIFDTGFEPGIADFLNGYEPGIDRIHLDNDIFTALGPTGALAPGRLKLGTAATDANDRIIYNSANGRMWYDVDGAGGAAKVAFALFVPGTVLSASDFLVVG